jgi:hypothetical protein
VLRVAVLAGLVAMGGCSGRSESPPSPSPSPPPPFAQDAGPNGTGVLPGVDPASDEGPVASRVAPTRPKSRVPRPIDITLKSSPPGAMAAVDGRPIGTTPTFWPGESDGLEHEFTFTRSGYASARYRFVPITSGVLHVTLEPVAAEPPGGDLGPLIAPQLAPDAGVAPPVSPPDAAVRPVAPPPPPAAPPTTGSAQPAPPASGAPGAPGAGSSPGAAPGSGAS